MEYYKHLGNVIKERDEAEAKLDESEVEVLALKRQLTEQKLQNESNIMELARAKKTITDLTSNLKKGNDEVRELSEQLGRVYDIESELHCEAAEMRGFYERKIQNLTFEMETMQRALGYGRSTRRDQRNRWRQ